MNPEESKRLVLRHAEKSKINAAWLASQLGEHRQTVWNWLRGIRDPQDPTIWNRIAMILGLAGVESEVLESARELALDVLVLSDNADLKHRAANLIREISKKSAPN